jgi:hypothetical protein
MLETTLSIAFGLIPDLPLGLQLSDFRDRIGNRLSHHLLGHQPYERIEESALKGKYKEPKVTLYDSDAYSVCFANKNPKLPDVTVKGNLKRASTPSVTRSHAKDLLLDSDLVAFSNPSGREVVFVGESKLLYYKGKSRIVLPV